SRRPVRTQLGTPNRRASGPRFLQPRTRPSRRPHRSLPVAPLNGVRGTTGRLRCGYGVATEGGRGRCSPHSTERRRTTDCVRTDSPVGLAGRSSCRVILLILNVVEIMTLLLTPLGLAV